MFDIGWSELLIIGIVALIVIGPKELPVVLRTVGQWTTKVRRMAAEFQSQFHEAMREAELAEMRREFEKDIDHFKDATRGVVDFDPVDTVRKEIETAIDDRPSIAPVAGSSTAVTVQGEAKQDIPSGVAGTTQRDRADATPQPEPKPSDVSAGRQGERSV
jgi:sec-independent protein translocase protein TatB